MYSTDFYTSGGTFFYFPFLFPENGRGVEILSLQTITVYSGVLLLDLVVENVLYDSYHGETFDLLFILFVIFIWIIC